MRRAWLELRPEDGGNANAHEVSRGGSSEPVREAKVSLAFCNLVVGLVVLMLGIVVVRWMEERRG